MTYSRKLGTASPNANPPMLKTPIVGEVDLGLIMPMISKINGGIESYRWGQNNKVEKEAIELHQESFKKYGILGSFVVVKVPKSFTAELDGQPHRYMKDTYITVDFTGRLRTLKDMKRLAMLRVGNVPISDVTESVLNNCGEITPEAFEDLWDAVVTLSTGDMPWSIYNFINSGAEIIVDEKNNKKFTLFRDSMRTYSGSGTGKNAKLTNNNVVNALMGRLPTDKELRSKKLDYDLDYMRYSKVTLDALLGLRQDMTRAMLPATFLDNLGRTILESAKRGYFVGCDWQKDSNGVFQRESASQKEVFPMSNGTPHKLYSDDHYFSFEDGLRKVCHTVKSAPPDDGYQPPSAAKRHIETTIYKAYNFYSS